MPPLPSNRRKRYGPIWEPTRDSRPGSLIGCSSDAFASEHTLTPIFRAALRCLVEAVLAGLWGCLSRAGMASRPVSLRWAGFPRAGGSFVSSGHRGGVLGEGGADPVPGGGDRRCPAPGGVDAQPELSGAAGDAGGDV